MGFQGLLQTGWTRPSMEMAAGLVYGYDYLVVDIETGNAAEAAVKEHFEKTYRCPRNIKDAAKIAANREKMWASAQEMAAVHPLAPIIAIGFKSEGELRCLHAMREHVPAAREIRGTVATVEGFGGERQMLEMASLLINSRVTGETTIAGLNIRDFDLPAIRRALARERMPLPVALIDREQAVFDNMVQFCRMFSGTHDIMASCAEVSAGLGIDPHGVAGKIVPELYAAGDFEGVIDKVLLDVLEEEEQFLRMTGRA